MLQYGFLSKRTHIFPYKIRSVLFHLDRNCLCQKVTRLQLIRKPLSVFIVEKSTFSADGLGDQKSSARFLGIKCSRMNLDVIEMLQLHMMFHGDSDAVPGNMRIIGGIME